jgi:hypothetical protein
MTVQGFEDREGLMADLTQSIVVASSAAFLSTVGALWTQIVAARINRRNVINDKRLEALVDVRQKIETAYGTWRGWAHVTINAPAHEDANERYTWASKAIHEAWYSTIVFEMYFPSLTPMMREFRETMGKMKDIASEQIARRTFDGSQYENIGPSLDDLTNRARKLLKLPES